MPASAAATLEATLSVSIPFRLVADRPAGSGPFPIVLAIHGYAMDAATMLALARRLVPEGVLLIAPQGPFSTIIPGTEGFGTGEARRRGPTPVVPPRAPHDHRAPEVLARSSERKAGFHWGVSPDPRDNRATHRAAVAAALAWGEEQKGERARTALIGFSQPCSFNYRFALEPPGESLAAVVGICGGIPGEWGGGEGPATAASRACDVLHVSTLEDPFYPLEKVATFSARLAARFRSATHVVMPGGHRIPSAARELVRAFLAERLGVAASP